MERVRQSLTFVERSGSNDNDELRIKAEDDAALFLWAAQWLDQHRDYIVHNVHLEKPSDDDDDTMTLVLSVSNAGEATHPEPRYGPWASVLQSMDL